MKKIYRAISLLAIFVSTSSIWAADFDSAAMVSAHNKWRTDVGVKQKLSYSPALAASSQVWANQLKQSNHCKMKHSEPDGRYGENLYWASALKWSDGRNELQKISPQHVVDSWGSEKADYSYKSNRCTPGKMCGHYTQVVWRTTQKVGCAMAVCKDTQQQIWVCQYQPAGNWMGDKPY